MVRQSWRILDFEYDDPYLNVALEEAILKCVGKNIVPCTLRLWRNSRAVIIGSSQCVELEVDLNVCKRQDIPVIRRVSGGGAVYHDKGNINYSIYVTKEHSFFKIFDDTSLAIVKALRSMGIQAVQKSRNAILVNGYKISGLAGAMKDEAIVIHGSLLLNSNLQVLSKVLSLTRNTILDGKRKYVRSNKMKVINLEEALHHKVSLSKVKRAIIQSFEETFSVKFDITNLNESEKRLAKNLSNTKYSSLGWTFKF